MSPPLSTRGRSANRQCFERNAWCTRAQLRISNVARPRVYKYMKYDLGGHSDTHTSAVSIVLSFGYLLFRYSQPPYPCMAILRLPMYDRSKWLLFMNSCMVVRLHITTHSQAWLFDYTAGVHKWLRSPM